MNILLLTRFSIIYAPAIWFKSVLQAIIIFLKDYGFKISLSAHKNIINLLKTSPYLDNVEVEKIKDFEKALLAYLHSEHTELMKTVAETGDYGDAVAAELKEALDNFVSTQTY